MSDHGQMVVISGPSGSGKNTVYEALCKRIPSLAQTVSATTRKPREGERDGIDYYFLTQAEFIARIETGAFVEYVKYGDNYYGTLRCEIERLIAMDKTVVLIIEVNGARRIKEMFPTAISVFIMPPSCEALRRRINQRGEMDEAELFARLKTAEEEMECRGDFDYCVVNDDLETCIDEIYDIIIKEKKEKKEHD